MKYLVFAGVIINLLLTFSYIKGVVKGTVQPNRISWLMWSIAPMIATVAAVPTVYKSWHQPESEEVRAYIGGFILAISSFFAITDWNFSSLAFPIYLVGLNVMIILALTRKKWQLD